MTSEASRIHHAAGEQLEHAGRWLFHGVLHGLLAFGVGMLASGAMRRGRLHWSWAGGAFAALALAHPRVDGSTWLLPGSALAAAVAARRAERLDIEAGADLAELAASRLRPSDLLRALAVHVGGAPGRVIEVARRRTREGIALGRDERGRTVNVRLLRGDGATHALVVGATGSGKTVTQAAIATAAIARGWPAVVVDPKGDRSMRERLLEASRSADLAFLEWTPAGPTVFNPYSRGGESEIADKLLAGERFSEPHYMRQAQRYVGHAVRALRARGVEMSLGTIVDSLSPERLEELARGCPSAVGDPVHAYLDSLTPRQRSDLGGIRDRLAILFESDVGRWLDPTSTVSERFDLLDAIRRRRVVYFNLQADSRPLVMQMLGAAIVQDILTAVAEMQTSPQPALVVLDEFSALASEQVTRLFGRSRSAGVSLVLGTQELADLRLPGREQLLEQVLGNLGVLIAHRQVVPASAQLIAGLAGTRGTWRVVSHSDGRTTRTRVREPILDPSRVMRLAPGWAVVTSLGHGGGTRIVRVSPPSPRS